MGGVCRMHGEVEVLTWIWWGNLRERDHLKDLGVDGRIILIILNIQEGYKQLHHDILNCKQIQHFTQNVSTTVTECHYLLNHWQPSKFKCRIYTGLNE
jgi:hypothetical protein